MKIASCQRYLIGTAGAEVRAERERALGWEVGVVDSGLSPEDYHWRVEGDDVLCFAVEPVTPEYLKSLGPFLMDQGARMVGIFDHNGKCVLGNFPEIKIKPEENEMKSKIKLNETLYQSGCQGCNSGITSATPVAWICEDTYAVVLRQDGAYRLEDMSAKQLSSFENCTKADKEREKRKELSELIGEIVDAHPERLAKLLLDMPEELQKIRPILDSAQKTWAEICLADDLPLHGFSAEFN